MNIYIYIISKFKKVSPSRRQPRGTAERFLRPEPYIYIIPLRERKIKSKIRGRTGPVSSLYAIVKSQPKRNRGSG